MPARTFSDSVEAILLTIWSMVLICSDKMMKTRAAKEKYATTLLNKKVEEQGNDRKYTVLEVHNEIDSLKKKAVMRTEPAVSQQPQERLWMRDGMIYPLRQQLGRTLNCTTVCSSSTRIMDLVNVWRA